ncbi:hypothetical protein D043_4236B, partial [Vibrio parahaemolyticus EKP-021]
AITTKQTREE